MSMSDEILNAIDQAVERSVKKNVNGRFDPESPTYCMKGIDERMARIDVHMEETKEILDALRGVRALGEIAKWISGVGVALAAMYALIRGTLKI